MGYIAHIRFQDYKEEIKVDENGYYDNQIKGAEEFLKRHPLNRPHDDKRRPYTIPVRPYWLVINGYVHLQTTEDRRIKS